MNRISDITIEGFWENKTMHIAFKDDVNFLIGVNGSGKTTIINLIAAVLGAEFRTLERLLYRKIRINLDPKGNKTAYIEVEKKSDNHARSFHQNIDFKIKSYDDKSTKTFDLDEIDEDFLIRLPSTDYYERRMSPMRIRRARAIQDALRGLFNVSWLSGHRASIQNTEERGYESAVDKKIAQLTGELVKYFPKLNGKCTAETEKFQKFIFRSLLDSSARKEGDVPSPIYGLNIENEKMAL